MRLTDAIAKSAAIRKYMTVFAPFYRKPAKTVFEPDKKLIA
jgi:hypothetical protein